MENLLDVRELSLHFGGVKAVNDVSFSVARGEIVAIIGPNGAGKTTIFNLLTGIYSPLSGSMLFRGKALENFKPNKITKLGVARTFQNLRLFQNMTVVENVMAGRTCRMKGGLTAAALRTPAFKRTESEALDAAAGFLEFVGLLDKANMIAKNLPYGEQRRLEIARALATGPSLLLLDEPTAGMNATESADLMALILKIRDGGASAILIEHDMKVVMSISDRVAVLDHGKKIAEGKPEEIQKNEAVIEAYLGKRRA